MTQNTTATHTVQHLSGLRHDHITEEQTQITLCENAQTVRILFEAAPVGIIVVDESGLIVQANQYAMQLFGYTEAELIGQPLILLIPENMRHIHLRHSAKCFEKPYIRSMGGGLDLYARHKNGHSFPAKISLGSVETQQGKLAMAFVVDITKQREAEQLREAMVQTMVHDLRNPLSNIMTILEMIEIGPHTDSSGLLDIAKSDAGKMLRLVNNILDVNRLEHGKMPLERDIYQIHALTEETLHNFIPQAQTKAITLENLIPQTLPPVWVDGQLIHRVLQNLIGNALKFTPEHGNVSVTARIDEHASDRILVSVSDNGPGIPPEIHNRVFDKFFTRSDVGDVHIERGSGLGLAFCKLVLEAHKECITAESCPGEGATFTFSLPIAEDGR